MLLKEEDVILGFRPSVDSVDFKHTLKGMVSLEVLTTPEPQLKNLNDKNLQGYVESLLQQMGDSKPIKSKAGSGKPTPAKNAGP